MSMCEEGNSRDDDFRRFLKSLDELEEFHRWYQEFRELRSKFTEELITCVAAVTYQYYTQEPLRPELTIEGELDEDDLFDKIANDEDFEFYGIQIFEELWNCIADFSKEEIPSGRKLAYKEIKYPTFTEEAVEEDARSLEKEMGGDLNAEQRQILLYSCRQDALLKEFYGNFRQSIHKALKKMAVDYFPEITEISATGLREIDYILYVYMLMMKKNLMEILDGVDVLVSVTEL